MSGGPRLSSRHADAPARRDAAPETAAPVPASPAPTPSHTTPAPRPLVPAAGRDRRAPNARSDTRSTRRVEQPVDQREPSRRPVTHRHRHGAIEGHHRRIIRAQQHVVERHDLPPVRRLPRSRRFGMDRRNRRLQRVGAEPARGDRAFDQRRAFARSARDSTAIDPGRPAGRLSRRRCVLAVAPRLVQQHQGQQTHRFGLGQQLHQQPPEPHRPRPTGRRASAIRRPTPNSPR